MSGRIIQEELLASLLVLEEMLRRGTRRGAIPHIGYARRAIGGMASGYPAGSILLCRPSWKITDEWSDAEEESIPYTVEAPIRGERLRMAVANRNPLLTQGCMVAVPERFLEVIWNGEIALAGESGDAAEDKSLGLTSLAPLFSSRVEEVRLAAITVVPSFLKERERLFEREPPACASREKLGILR